MAYARTTFRTDYDDQGNPGRIINPGDEITASDLDVDDEEFQRLIDNGSISEEESEFVDPTPHPIQGTVDLEEWSGGDSRELTEEEGEEGKYDDLGSLASGADMPEPGSTKLPESLTQGEGEPPQASPEQQQQTQQPPPAQPPQQ